MRRGAELHTSSSEVSSPSLGCIRYPQDDFQNVATVDFCVTNPIVGQKDRDAADDPCQGVISWVIRNGAPAEINSRPLLQGMPLEVVFRTVW